MNYLKNRYPFKFFTSFFRIATRTTDALQSIIEPKRNKSDTILTQRSSKESVQLKSKSSMSFEEAQSIEKPEPSPASSNCSLPQSKTSSEHSLTRGYTSWDLSNDDVIQSKRRTRSSTLEREIDHKIHKLQESFNQNEKPMLKRSYPWQNFNLNTISQEHLEPKRVARCHSNTSIQSDCSMTSLCSNHSLKSLNSSSSCSLVDAPLGSLEDIKNQMPMFKSILRKPAFKLKTPKAVTFHNISTIYGSSAKAGKKQTTCANKEGDGDGASGALGRHEPLKEEHSFMKLYYGKNNKTPI